MAEENQVTMKDPKKVEAGKRLIEYNHRKREELKEQKSKVEPELNSSTCYGIGVVLIVAVIGSLGYYLYQGKKGEVPHQQSSHPQTNNPPQQPRPQTNNFEME